MVDFGPGLYDQLIDGILSERLDAIAQQRLTADIQDVDPAELPDRLGEVLGRRAHDALSAVGPDKRAEAAIELSRAVLEAIANLQPDAVAPDRALAGLTQPSRTVAPCPHCRRGQRHERARLSTADMGTRS
jgi:hypothetical protein